MPKTIIESIWANANKAEAKISAQKEVLILPRGDRTGPLGMGPLTGRGLVLCRFLVCRDMPTRDMGLVSARGFERRQGFRKLFSTEKDYLTKQAEVLEDQLQQVKQRLQELNQEPKRSLS